MIDGKSALFFVFAVVSDIGDVRERTCHYVMSMYCIKNYVCMYVYYTHSWLLQLSHDEIEYQKVNSEECLRCTCFYCY